MKNFKIYFFTVVLAIFATTSCVNKSFDELLADPDEIRPENIDLNAGLVGIQQNFVALFHSAQKASAKLTRMEYMFGSTYEIANGPSTASGTWNSAYKGILPETKLLIEKAQVEESEEFIPILKILRAYTLMTLVDLWGDVPYSEALLGEANLNPKADAGDDVYAVALADLNDAIARLDNPDLDMSDIEDEDFFYNGNVAKWKKLANTLKFKYFLNVGNVSELNTLIADDDMLGVEDDFMYRYDNNTKLGSRHPEYSAYTNEEPSGGTYMSTYYMYILGFEKAIPDPRTRYYFYRQEMDYPTATDVPSITDVLPCSDDDSPYAPGVPFCSLPNGYWGRDHGNDDGIPPDGDDRTVFGVYPAGGRFDANDDDDISDEEGLVGKGISPIMMASYVNFMKAEAVLRLGATGTDAKTELENGVRGSIEFVKAFGSSLAAGTGYEPSAGYVNYYVNNLVLNAYDAASSDDKLKIVAKEYFIALFGNGLEAYNLYRRTGAPDNLQPMLLGAGGGAFPHSLYYTIETATLNSSIAQKPDLTQRVFWDTFNYNLY